METERNVTTGQRGHIDNLKLTDVNAFISHMDGLINTLTTRIRVLPEVNENGQSDCPFAEELYAAKDEAADDVEKELGKLDQYLGLVEQETGRCQKNLSQISSDASALTLDETTERYELAKRAQKIQLNKAIEHQDSLEALRDRAQSALSEAREREFPGKKPEKRSRITPRQAHVPTAENGTGLGTWEQAPSFNQESRFNTEMENLIALGPMGREGM